MKYVYLALAVLGTVVPYAFFISHFQSEGLGLGTFVRAAFTNGASGGMGADLLISSVVFWVWLARNKVEKAWVFVGLNLAIGLSCALPLCLYLREGRKDRIAPG